MIDTIRDLRCAAINNTLFKQTTLSSAIKRMGFVQADPIRSPACAQDLILRQRVKSYRVGDLERRYNTLDLEEDYLYAYGFLPRANWLLLHPRNYGELSELERKVLRVVEDVGEVHPRDLQQHFGAERIVNAWGGFSKATTRALEQLQDRGLLRIARREKGIRVYAKSTSLDQPVDPKIRCERLVLLLVNIFAPIARKSLHSLRFSKPESCSLPDAISKLLKSGDLVSVVVDNTEYLFQPEQIDVNEPPDVVRLLAPFDPLIWDRNRFEKFWNWSYRFEAYTPIVKRVRGYYALPMLWQDNIIGWANVSVIEKKMNVEVGYVGKPPRSVKFTSQLNEEIERLEFFLRL